MATYYALVDFHFFGVDYVAGAMIDVTGWPTHAIEQLIGTGNVSVQPPGGGTGGGPETDPVAGPRVTTETSRAQAAESAEATRAQAAEASKAAASALTSETSRATAAEQAASTAASNEASRATAAESSEATRAQAAESAESTARSGHASSTTAHPASSVTVNPSGLVVVTTANVQAALAQLDTQVHTNAQNTRIVPDLIGNRPTPAVFGVGWYWATDDNLGTLYHSDGTTWTKITTGISWASGTQLAYAEINTISPAVSATIAGDINAALTITVPASSVPVKVQGRILGQQATGASAAVGSFDTLVVALTDAANNVLDFDVSPAVQVTLASKVWYHTFKVETVFSAPFAGGTYKLRTYLLNTLPTGWTASLLATGPTWPKAWIKAVAE